MEWPTGDPIEPRHFLTNVELQIAPVIKQYQDVAAIARRTAENLPGELAETRTSNEELEQLQKPPAEVPDLDLKK